MLKSSSFFFFLLLKNRLYSNSLRTSLEVFFQPYVFGERYLCHCHTFFLPKVVTTYFIRNLHSRTYHGLSLMLPYLTSQQPVMRSGRCQHSQSTRGDTDAGGARAQREQVAKQANGRAGSLTQDPTPTHRAHGNAFGRKEQSRPAFWQQEGIRVWVSCPDRLLTMEK